MASVREIYKGIKLGNHRDVLRREICKEKNWATTVMLGRASLLGKKLLLTINRCWAGHRGSKKKKSNFQKSTKFNWQGIASRIKKLKL